MIVDLLENNSDLKTLRNIHLQIALNVRINRQKKGISQYCLARMIGHKTSGMISFAEAGLNNKHFSIKHLIKITKALDISIFDLFKGVDEILEKADKPHL